MFLLRPPFFREIIDQGLMIPDGGDGQKTLLLAKLPHKRLLRSLTDEPGQDPAIVIARTLSPVHGGEHLCLRYRVPSDYFHEPLRNRHTRRVEGEVSIRTGDQRNEVRRSRGEEAGQDANGISVFSVPARIMDIR